MIPHVSIHMMGTAALQEGPLSPPALLWEIPINTFYFHEKKPSIDSRYEIGTIPHTIVHLSNVYGLKREWLSFSKHLSTS